MAVRGTGLVVLLALALLALNPGVPAEQAAAQEIFELRGDFDVTLLEAGTVTANEITLFIPADGGDVSGTSHLRIEEFPFVLDLFGGCFNLFAPVAADECESDVPYPDCTITIELSGGVITGSYSADSSQLAGTTVYIASFLDPTNCPPDFVEGQEQNSASWEGTFDEALQFARGTIGDLEDRLGFSAAVVGSSGGAATEEAGPTPTLAEEEAGPTPTEKPQADPLLFGLELLAGAGEEITLSDEDQESVNKHASKVADSLVAFTVGEPTPLQGEAAALFGLAAGLSKLEDPEGNLLFPSFKKRAVTEVILQLFTKAFGWDSRSGQAYADRADPEARVALERFIRLMAAMDQEARRGGGR